MFTSTLTYQAVTAALQSAQTVYDTVTATQAMVDEQAAALQSALDALVENNDDGNKFQTNSITGDSLGVTGNMSFPIRQSQQRRTTVSVTAVQLKPTHSARFISQTLPAGGRFTATGGAAHPTSQHVRASRVYLQHLCRVQTTFTTQ